MMIPARTRDYAAFLLSGLLAQAAEGPGTGEKPWPGRNDAALYHWFSLPIEVRGLPAQAEFVPVSCSIDFSAILKRLNAPGTVDERSLRLYRVAKDESETEEPVQFSSSPQPRPKERRMLPGSPSGASYVGEYGAEETPDPVKVTGELAWAARAGALPVASAPEIRDTTPATQAGARYRLKFGTLRAGTLIQVPFPPQNLRAFDVAGRATPVPWFPRLQLHPQWPMDGAVQILDQNQLVTSYRLGPIVGQAGSPALSIRRPFFYPVTGPDGIALTEFGKPHDPTGSHAHHYSLWIAHASVNGQDYWSEKGGTIAHEQFELMEDGPVFCRLIQKTRWILKGEELLHERRQITVYATPKDFRLMDIDLEFTPAGAVPVTLGKTTFGFLAARVAQSMTVFDGGGEILNAACDRNEQGAHLKRAAWLDQSGPVAPGQWGGLAILDHPRNVNHPTMWHCRNDGWAGAALSGDNARTLEPESKLRLRYRVHLHRHDAARGQVARRFEEFSAAPLIEVGAAKAEK